MEGASALPRTVELRATVRVLRAAGAPHAAAAAAVGALFAFITTLFIVVVFSKGRKDECAVYVLGLVLLRVCHQKQVVAVVRTLDLACVRALPARCG